MDDIIQQINILARQHGFSGCSEEAARLLHEKTSDLLKSVITTASFKAMFNKDTITRDMIIDAVKSSREVPIHTKAHFDNDLQ